MNIQPLVFALFLYLMIGGGLVAASLKRLGLQDDVPTRTVIVAAILATIVWLPAIIFKQWRDR